MALVDAAWRPIASAALEIQSVDGAQPPLCRPHNFLNLSKLATLATTLQSPNHNYLMPSTIYRRPSLYNNVQNQAHHY